MKSINRHSYLDRIQFFITILDKFDYEDKNHYLLIGSFEKIYATILHEYDIHINMSELFQPFVQLLLAKYLSSPYKVAAFNSIRYFLDKKFKNDIILDSNFEVENVIDSMIRFQYIQSEISADKIVYFELISTFEAIIFNEVDIIISSTCLINIVNKLIEILLENNMGREELVLSTENLLMKIFENIWSNKFSRDTSLSSIEYVLNKLEAYIVDIDDNYNIEDNDTSIISSINFSIPNINPKNKEIILYIRVLKLLFQSENLLDLFYRNLINERIIIIIIQISLNRKININIFEEIINLFVCICHTNLLEISILIEYMMKYIYVKCFADIANIYNQTSKSKQIFHIKEVEIIVNSLIKLISLRSFLPSLYLTFDCNPNKISLCNNLIDNILITYRLLQSYKTNLFFVNLLVQLLLVISNNSSLSTMITICYHELCHRLYTITNTNHNNDIVKFQQDFLSSIKSIKEIVKESSIKFTEKPRNAIIFLQENKLLSNNININSIVNYLRENNFLSKTSIGAFLGELGHDGNNNIIDKPEFHSKLLINYIQSFNIENLDLLSSLRLFLSSFRLPGEAQQIDRILVAFADHCYNNCKESLILKIFDNVDIIYLLLFSIIMLNTDRHNPNIKLEKKMTLEQFIRNNLFYGNDVKQKNPLPKDFLENIYHSINTYPLKTEGCDINSNYQYENLLDMLRYNRKNTGIYMNIDNNKENLSIHSNILYNISDYNISIDLLQSNENIYNNNHYNLFKINEIFLNSYDILDITIITDHLLNILYTTIYPATIDNNNNISMNIIIDNKKYIDILDNFHYIIEKNKNFNSNNFFDKFFYFLWNFINILNNHINYLSNDIINYNNIFNIIKSYDLLNIIIISKYSRILFILLLQCLSNISLIQSKNGLTLYWYILCLFHDITILPKEMILDKDIDIIPIKIREDFDNLIIKNQLNNQINIRMIETKYNYNYKDIDNNNDNMVQGSFHDFAIFYLFSNFNEKNVNQITRNLLSLTDLKESTLNSRLYDESTLFLLISSLCEFIENKLSSNNQESYHELISLSSISWLENYLFEIAIRNRERIHIIWNRLKDHVTILLHPKAIVTYVIERVIIGILRLSSRLLSRDGYRDDIIDFFGRLFRSPSQLQRINMTHNSLSNWDLSILSPQISSGIWLLITSNVDALLNFTLIQWRILFDIMSNCADKGGYASIRIFELLAWMIHEPRLIAEVPIFCVAVINPLVSNEDVPITVSVAAAQLLYILHSRLEVLSASSPEETIDSSENDNVELWENCWIPILKTLMSGVLNSRHEIRLACSSIVCKCICDKLVHSVPIGVLINSLTDILMPTITSYVDILHKKSSHVKSTEIISKDDINDEVILIKLMEALCTTITLNLSRLANYPSFDKLWLGLLNLFSCFDGNISKFEGKSSQSEILNFLSYLLQIASKEGIFIGRNALWQVTINAMSSMKNILDENDLISDKEEKLEELS